MLKARCRAAGGAVCFDSCPCFTAVLDPIITGLVDEGVRIEKQIDGADLAVITTVS